jgi:hypothetical protein
MILIGLIEADFFVTGTFPLSDSPRILNHSWVFYEIIVRDGILQRPLELRAKLLQTPLFGFHAQGYPVETGLELGRSSRLE